MKINKYYVYCTKIAYFFIIHAHIHVNKLVDKRGIMKRGILNILPKGKSSFESNQIFMRPFLYLIGLPPIIVSI